MLFGDLQPNTIVFFNISSDLDSNTKPKGLADTENIQDGEGHRKNEGGSKTYLLATQGGA